MTTNSKKDTKVIDKIKKLLALSKNNSNSNEAQNSLLKAQELMAKYNISVSESDTEDITHISVGCEHKWDLGYRHPLGIIIAKNFRCKMYFHGKKVTFFGRDVDAKIAKEVFEYAYRFINTEGTKRYDRAYKDGVKTKGVFNSYALGFIEGLEEAFNEQCRALMIITPKDVEDKYLEMSNGWGEKSSSVRASQADIESFFEGKSDGKSFLNKKKQIETA